MIELKEICKVQCGFAFDSKKFTEDSSYYPLIRIRDVKRGFTQTYYTGEFSSEYIVHKGDLLVGMDGEFNIARWNSDDALLNQRVCRIITNNNTNEEYLRFYLKRTLKLIESKTSFVTVKHLSAKELNSLKLNFPCIEDQQRISKQLSTLELMIRKNKQVLELLDELVKARFVEMFGDPVINSHQLPVQPMTEICDIIDGDRGKNYPKAEDFFDTGYCLFLNAKNVTQKGFDFDICNFITREKDEALRKGKLSRGDVILTTRGTVGNLAYYSEDVPYENIRINSGMVILRMDRSVLNEIYFIELFKMKLSDIKEKIASGSAQPQLPISTMNKIILIISPLELQNQFASFVQEVDKSRLLNNHLLFLLKSITF